MTRLRVFGAAALFCWLVAMFLLVVPVSVGNARCGRPVTVALSDEGGCGAKAAGRVQGVAFWLLLTAPITLGYFARKAAAGPERPE